MRTREWDRVDWDALEEAITGWAAGHPDGTVDEAIAALKPKHPGDRDTMWFFRIHLRDARWARDLAALRKWAPDYEVTAMFGVRFTIRRGDGTGNELQAASDEQARALIDGDRAEVRARDLADLKAEFPEYEIKAGKDGFTACRRDGTSGTIAGKTKAEMRTVIGADRGPAGGPICKAACHMT